MMPLNIRNVGSFDVAWIHPTNLRDAIPFGSSSYRLRLMSDGCDVHSILRDLYRMVI